LNDLHLALFALGALLLLAVYVNGKWQERRLLRRLRDRLHGGLGDALLQAGSSIRERDEVRIGDVRKTKFESATYATLPRARKLAGSIRVLPRSTRSPT